MSATQSEPTPHDPFQVGGLAMPLDRAEWIEEQIKIKIPDYNPGKVVESAKFLNEVKVS
jgi:hypothetical protein